MKKNKMVTIHLIALLFLLVGLAVTTASIVLLVSYNQKSKIYKPTTAVVVDHKEKSNGLKAIIIEYNIKDKYYRLTSKHYDKKPEAIDAKVKIKYNPKNHNEIIWVDNNHNHKYLMAGIILLLGDAIIWLISFFTGKKRKLEIAELTKTRGIDIPMAHEEQEEIKLHDTEDVVEEPIVEEQPAVEETIIEEYDPSVPLFEKEEIPEIFTPNPIEEQIENPVIEEPIEEEKIVIEEETVQEPVIEMPVEIENQVPEEETIPEIELPVLNEEEQGNTQELDLPKLIIEEEPTKITIPEIPYDLDSPREAVVSNVMETTIAIPTLNREMIDLYAQSPERPKQIKINDDMKNDALSKLLDDIEKKG